MFLRVKVVMVVASPLCAAPAPLTPERYKKHIPITNLNQYKYKGCLPNSKYKDGKDWYISFDIG